MIEATYKTNNGRLLFKITGTLQTEVWQQVAELEGAFGADSQCGVCGSTSIRYNHRLTKQGYHYYELVCADPTCGARLNMGQSTQVKGLLYPDRKDDAGNWLPNRGWAKYEPGKTNSKPNSAQEPEWGGDWR